MSSDREHSSLAEQITSTTQRACARFALHFRRLPTDAERMLMELAVVDYFVADEPTQKPQ